MGSNSGWCFSCFCFSLVSIPYKGEKESLTHWARPGDARLLGARVTYVGTGFAGAKMGMVYIGHTFSFEVPWTTPQRRKLTCKHSSTPT